MSFERAEAGTRPKMTELDKRQYTGIARQPLARKWLLKRLIEAQERAEGATDATTRNRWDLEVERLGGQLRRLGISGGGE